MIEDSKDEDINIDVTLDDVIEFTKVVAEMGTAFELPVDQLAQDMGKIANMYKIPIKNIDDLADTINYLDDKAIASGKDIIDFMQRVGGTASMVKISDKNTAALGSTLLTLGEKAETSATAITKAVGRAVVPPPIPGATKPPEIVEKNPSNAEALPATFF